MTTFIPRAAFPVLDSLPRSYYLGHHAAGLQKMRTLLSQIDLIIECRDYRVPLTSHNPQFEENLAGKTRMLVYTKKDVGRDMKQSKEYRKQEELLRTWHKPSPVLFTDCKQDADMRAVIDQVKEANVTRGSLTGSFVMVVGMPNIGKSSLLNALRRVGVGRGKAVRTGAQPGITRKIAKSGVKIIEGTDDSDSIYLIDTPGVFIPYVPDAEAMLKLALCGSVKDTIISPVTLADYLLFHINKHVPTAYSAFHRPTNDISMLLEEIARRTGRLGKAGAYDHDASALWFIQKWRDGLFGKFILDDVSQESLEAMKAVRADAPVSVNQARKAAKTMSRQKVQHSQAT